MSEKVFEYLPYTFKVDCFETADSKYGLSFAVRILSLSSVRWISLENLILTIFIKYDNFLHSILKLAPSDIKKIHFCTCALWHHFKKRAKKSY